MRTMPGLWILGMLAILLAPAHAADGIRQLQGVSQQKAEQANDDAQHGADKQRDLINKQKTLRKSRAAMDKKRPALEGPAPAALQKKLLRGLTPADELGPRLARVGALLREIQRLQARAPGDRKALQGKAAQARRELGGLRDLAARLATGFDEAERHVSSKGGKQAAEQLRARFEDMLEDLESQDKMGNFEIQRLMSQYNQSEKLASSVQKKKDDTANAVIGKIG